MLVRTLQCPHCGGRTKLARGEMEAHCLHCGRPVKLSDAMLQEQSRAAKWKTRTPVRLGMTATIGDKVYEVTGRQVFEQREDGEVYRWEEWVLVAPSDGEIQYLEFDEGKWKRSQPFTPKSPVGPDQLNRLHAGSPLALDGKGALVSDKGVATVVHAEGEFPYVVRLNEPRSFLDATHLGKFYSVEWTPDSVEYYRGQFIGERQLYTYFGWRDKLLALNRREQTARQRQKLGAACLALSLVALVIWAYSFFSGSPVPGASGTVALTAIQGQEGRRFGPFRLTEVGAVHRLELHGRMREESNWVQAILEDSEEQELLASERDMWDESGYEDGEYWHESDLSASTDFILRKPGEYYVRLYTEPDPGRTPSPNAMASFVVKQRAVYPVWVGIYGFVALLVGILCLATGRPTSGGGGD